MPARGRVSRALASGRSWLLVAVPCLAVLVVAALAELIPGSQAGAGFFTTCATVGPLFGLALAVEIPLVMGPVIESQGATEANKDVVRALIRINSTMLLVSEGSALYAIGTQRTSAFLVACSVLPWLVQLGLLVQTTYYRTGVHQIGPG